MKKFLKDYSYTWWQIAVFKVAMLSLGVAAGTYWNEFFEGWLMYVVALAVVATLYTLYVSFLSKK